MWQPIETAPVNEPVWVMEEFAGGKTVFLAMLVAFDGGQGIWCKTGEVDWDIEVGWMRTTVEPGRFRSYAPVRWHPLPSVDGLDKPSGT